MEACCRRWIGCLVARQGREEAREFVAAAATAYEELGARIDAVSTAAFGRADVALLAGDDAGRVPRSGTGTTRSATSARSATVRRSRRCSPAPCTPAVTPRRRTSSPARWRRPCPSMTSGRKRSTVSPEHDSSSMPARPARRSASRGTRSRSSNRPTCSICGRRPARARHRAPLRGPRRRGTRALRRASSSTRRRGTSSPLNAPAHSSSSRLRSRTPIRAAMAASTGLLGSGGTSVAGGESSGERATACAPPSRGDRIDRRAVEDQLVLGRIELAEDLASACRPRGRGRVPVELSRSRPPARARGRPRVGTEAVEEEASPPSSASPARPGRRRDRRRDSPRRRRPGACASNPSSRARAPPRARARRTRRDGRRRRRRRACPRASAQGSPRPSLRRSSAAGTPARYSDVSERAFRFSDSSQVAATGSVTTCGTSSASSISSRASAVSWSPSWIPVPTTTTSEPRVIRWGRNRGWLPPAERIHYSTCFRPPSASTAALRSSSSHCRASSHP